MLRLSIDALRCTNRFVIQFKISATCEALFFDSCNSTKSCFFGFFFTILQQKLFHRPSTENIFALKFHQVYTKFIFFSVYEVKCSLIASAVRRTKRKVGSSQHISYHHWCHTVPRPHPHWKQHPSRDAWCKKMEPGSNCAHHMLLSMQCVQDCCVLICFASRVASSVDGAQARMPLETNNQSQLSILVTSRFQLWLVVGLR